MSDTHDAQGREVFTVHPEILAAGATYRPAGTEPELADLLRKLQPHADNPQVTSVLVRGFDDDVQLEHVDGTWHTVPTAAATTPEKP